jgi:hypothetical protein
MRTRRIFSVSLPVVLIAAAAALPAGANAEVPVIPPGPSVAVHASAGQDLRSPDARDAAAGISVAAVHTEPVAEPSVSDGFEWADAGIGAAIALALVAMAGGTLLLAARTRRRTA